MDARGLVTINGFTVVPIKFAESSKTSHILYMKEHSLHRDDTKPKGRTLFLANIPPYCTKEALYRIFSQFGEVQDAFFSDDEPEKSEKTETYFPDNSIIVKGFKMGYVIYKNKQHMMKVLESSYDKAFIISTKIHPVSTGLAKWQKEYKMEKLDTILLQDEVDQYMESYDKRLKEQLNEEKEQEGVADDEGWITVTKHGKMRPTPRTDINQKKLTKKYKKKKKERELLNFYTFQIKQEKQDKIAILRQKFEEDKERISQMKEARKFKPY